VGSGVAVRGSGGATVRLCTVNRKDGSIERKPNAKHLDVASWFGARLKFWLRKWLGLDPYGFTFCSSYKQIHLAEETLVVSARIAVSASAPDSDDIRRTECSFGAEE
jgi:hypothetical protein